MRFVVRMFFCLGGGALGIYRHIDGTGLCVHMCWPNSVNSQKVIGALAKAVKLLRRMGAASRRLARTLASPFLTCTLKFHNQ